MFFKNKNQNRGFSLIELTVTAVIIITISLIVIVNYRGYNASSALDKEADRLSSIIRRTHVSALTGQLVNNTRPTGYGIYLETCLENCQIIVFADDGDYLYNPATDNVIRVQNFLNQDIQITEIVPNNHLHIIFVAPDGSAYIDASTVSDNAVIVLKLKGSSQNRELVFDRHTGKIDINN